MTSNQLRQKYLNFFTSRGHAVIPSASLVPENDSTTLFTSAGMQPLVPYLLGEEHPEGTRLVNSQKCFRSQDIEEVGDNRHTTFFEMLGNWSLGDYGKREQLSWFFEFLTKELKISKDKLWVSVFKGNDSVPKDKEAKEIWLSLGMSEDRILEYEADKNWWSRSGEPQNMPVGELGGPDSEVFYEFTSVEHNSKFGKKCHPNCDCGRFLEIGNSVFMEYVKTTQGFAALKKKNIDFGGGLERILAALNNNPDIFMTDLFLPIIKKLEEMSGLEYQGKGQEVKDKVKFSMRVIADHVRAATMLMADGVQPSNKAQGYFVRRLLRRAMRQGQKLKMPQEFLGELVGIVAQIYIDQYPEVQNQALKIKEEVLSEEKKFSQTLAKGLRVLQKFSRPILDAQFAFDLYQTYGFPLELSLEEAKNLGLRVSAQIKLEFERIKQQHAAASQKLSAGMFKGGLQDKSEVVVKYHTATHLLHAALRRILGKKVEQRGSNITAERLRFDFSFDRALTSEEKEKIENLINKWIDDDLAVTKQVMPKKQALDSGVLAFFAQRYPDEVSVYSIGEEGAWVSRELCGGPHVSHTGEIGKIKITKEKSASAGVRRIYMELGE